MDCKGKTAIVTGANSGMGMATVEALSDKGANVIMLCRNADRGQKAFDQLTQEKDRDIKLMLCDLGNFDSIRNFVKEFREENDRLDILINNAGFISLDRQETDNGLERQIGINYCKIAKSSKRSKDMAAAKRLFRMSCEITGLKN